MWQMMLKFLSFLTWSGLWRIWSFNETEVGEMLSEDVYKSICTSIKYMNQRSWYDCCWCTSLYNRSSMKLIKTNCMCLPPPQFKFVINFLTLSLYWFSFCNKFSKCYYVYNDKLLYCRTLSNKFSESKSGLFCDSIFIGKPYFTKSA